MTLHNAFDGLATEPKQDAVIEKLTEILDATGTIKSGGVTVDGMHPLPVAAVFADENGVPYSETNPLPTEVQNLTVENLNVAFPDSLVSEPNSTTTPLPANGEFLGPWTEVLAYSAISCIVMSDVASALNGAAVEFSADGVTVLRSIGATIPANVGLTFMFAPEARYFRLRYRNGTTAQATFTGQTILHYQFPTPPQLPVGATTSDITIAKNTLAHIKGRSSSGLWVPVQVGSDGAVKVAGTVSLDGTTLAALPQPQTDALTDAELRAAPVDVADPNTQRRFGGAKLAYSGLLTSDHLIDPSAVGNAIRVLWVAFVPSPDNSAANLVQVGFNGDVPFYTGYALAHWEVFEGAPDQAVLIDLATAEPVAVTVHYEEFVP